MQIVLAFWEDIVFKYGRTVAKECCQIRSSRNNNNKLLDYLRAAMRGVVAVVAVAVAVVAVVAVVPVAVAVVAVVAVVTGVAGGEVAAAARQVTRHL